MKRFLVITMMLAGFVLTHMVAAQTTEFSYDGRVRSGGVPFDGNGLFKFAIVSGDGAICYWSNDGVTLTGNEPTSSIQIAVSAGFFSVIMGDDSIANMAPLDASIFNTDERVLLRVWFNDGINGFQRLSPDRPITNPRLIGLQSARELKLYVNPTTGNDHNSGMQPNRAKATIQAAWDVLPPLLQTSATIILANGIYRQSANLTGKIAIGGKITLQGNVMLPAQVRFTGTTESNATTVALESALAFSSQRDVLLRGISIDHYQHGISIEDQSAIQIENCAFTQYSEVGVLIGNSYLHCKNSKFSYPTTASLNNAIQAHIASMVTLTDCYFLHVNVACSISRASQFNVVNCLFENGTYLVVDASECSGITFGTPNSTIKDTNRGLLLRRLAWATYNNAHVNYINCPYPIELQSYSTATD